MKRFVVLLFVLAACPRKGGGGGPVTPVGGAGCPSANNVYVASYLQPEEGEKNSHVGWVLPLADKAVASLANVPEYAPLDAAAAAAAGVPAPPANVWLLVPGAPPCRPTVGSYYAAAIDAPTPNISYGVELTNCNAPPDPQNPAAVVVVSDESPGQCQLVPPKPVAARLGDIDKQGKWSRPTKDAPIPPAFAAVIPPHECTPPACEKLYAIANVEVDGKPVAWAGAVNWLKTSAADPCQWKGDQFTGFFVANGDALVRVTESQDHPLALTGVLIDRSGAKVLVGQGPGEYTTYDLVDGKPSVGRHLVWLLPHPDSYASVAALGPDCGM